MAHRLVVLLGTDHSMQAGKLWYVTQAAIDAFEVHIRELCAATDVQGIAEEMSREALPDGKESIPHKVAQALGIAHRYCDPNLEERAALGVKYVESRPAARQLLGLPRATDAELNEQQRLEGLKREPFWMKRVLDLDTWPLLFVCGSDHVGSFGALLLDAGIDVAPQPNFDTPEGEEVVRGA